MAAIHDGLWMVVNGGGTAPNARLPGYDVAGKTGTAQVISLEGARALKGRTTLDLRDNGWFVFFAPRDNPQIAGVVFTEHGAARHQRRATSRATSWRRSSPSGSTVRCRSSQAAGAAGEAGRGGDGREQAVSSRRSLWRTAEAVRYLKIAATDGRAPSDDFGIR